MLNKFFVWLGKIFSSSDEASSKRLFGGIMVVWVMILITNNNQHPLTQEALYIGAVLIGLDRVIKSIDLFKKGKV